VKNETLKIKHLKSVNQNTARCYSTNKTRKLNKILTLLIFGLLLSSCASILNNIVQKVAINSDKRIEVVSVDSSLKILDHNEFFYVVRSRNPLRVNLKIDGKDSTILLKSHNSVAFWANIDFNYGVGMLVDLKNPKRFAYPKRTYLNIKDAKVYENRFAPTLKGTINWNIAIPYVNSFNIKTTGMNKNLAGFWGFETGLDYYYKDNRFLSFNAGAATNFLVPVPAPVDIFGENQTSSGLYLNLRNNYDVGRFTLGYGLSYSKLYWQITNNSDSTFIPQSKSNSAFGISLNSSYRFGESFRLGLLYQPYFFSSEKKFTTDYQYQISIELIWKIPLRYGSTEK